MLRITASNAEAQRATSLTKLFLLFLFHLLFCLYRSLCFYSQFSLMNLIKKPFDDKLPLSAPHCFHDAFISKFTFYVRLLQTLHPFRDCHLQGEKQQNF